jgi:hypothetical protein
MLSFFVDQVPMSITHPYLGISLGYGLICVANISLWPRKTYFNLASQIEMMQELTAQNRRDSAPESTEQRWKVEGCNSISSFLWGFQKYC